MISARAQQQLFLVFGFVLLAAVMYLSLSTTVLELPGDSNGRLAHVGAYALMMFWFTRIYRGARSALIIGAGLLALGVLIEFLQGYGGHRDFEYADMAADAVGIALGWAAGWPLAMSRLAEARQAS